ncbi:MAG TPA: CPBP family intramembrane glutamic endopeptidase [Kofleriaceae bacterium]|nr:CPBP family intramembrane glutamic endopeptidase [Kofleriaceae bacterium]
MPGRWALYTYLVVAALVAVLVRIDVTLPAIGHLGSALVAVVFLYGPVIVAWKRKEDLVDYGFTSDPRGKNLAFAAVALAIILPIFLVVYLGFYDVVCDTPSIRKLAPPGTCGGWDGINYETPRLGWSFLEFCAVQIVVVALPEELFFRGCLHHLLEQRFPPARRFLGGGIGLALLLSSAAFALVHLPKNGDPRALATFFPGLLFGWMRSATGSIAPSVAVHAASNIWVRLLDLTFLR